MNFIGTTFAPSNLQEQLVAQCLTPSPPYHPPRVFKQLTPNFQLQIRERPEVVKSLTGFTKDFKSKIHLSTS